MRRALLPSEVLFPVDAQREKIGGDQRHQSHKGSGGQQGEKDGGVQTRLGKDHRAAHGPACQDGHHQDQVEPALWEPKRKRRGSSMAVMRIPKPAGATALSSASSRVAVPARPRKKSSA